MQHIADEKISYVERGVDWMLTRARRVGSHASLWAEAMLRHRDIEGVRVLSGLLSLTNKHRPTEIERACETAYTHGAFRLRIIRSLLKRQAPHQDLLEFVDKHPIIRDLSEYAVVAKEEPA